MGVTLTGWTTSSLSIGLVRPAAASAAARGRHTEQLECIVAPSKKNCQLSVGSPEAAGVLAS